MSEQIYQERPEETAKMSIAELSSILKDAGIDTALYGQGKAKTLDHLLKEINEGEMKLVKNEQGELQRKVTVGKGDILYIAPDGKTFRLREEKQVFRDGRIRERKQLKEAVSEKIKPGEDGQEAMIRGIQEELGINGEINIAGGDSNLEEIESPSYPGLKTEYDLRRFKVYLGSEQYNPEGYIEKQPDKTTYFTWEEVKD